MARIGTATLILALMLSWIAFPLVVGITSKDPPEVFEGSGPVLQSRIVTQSSSATFVKKGFILYNYQYVLDKIEYPIPDDSIAFGKFGPATWANLYWTTRDYQSAVKEGFTLFSNEVFQVRYTPIVDGNYFRINSTYPQLVQNFTVPSSYDHFEVKYVWLVVRVFSGSARFHAEIWNYGMISVGTSTESVNVTGPYEWWVAMKMMSPRVLNAVEAYRLDVVWEAGQGVDVKLMTDSKDADDNAQGSAKFFNTTSGFLENIAGRMLEGVLTRPVNNIYSASFGTWSKALPLQSYRVYLHGRNIPRSNIAIKVNSLNFGTGVVPEVRLSSPVGESAFWTSVQGSTSFSGGVIEISSDLVSLEQGRTSYDEDHLPPFFRPFASLTIFTDNAGKPWGEWVIGGGKWDVYVLDAYGNLCALPAERVEQRELGLKAIYTLLFYPPASPSYGFMNFTVKFDYTIEVSFLGPELYSSYSVCPLNYASWNISNAFLSFAASPHSSVTIKIGPVPRDWVLQKAYVTPGPGGGTPSVSIANDEITISKILMGASSNYSGRVEICFKADNYLESQDAFVKFIWSNIPSSLFLQNDTIRIEARAASAVPSFPPGFISIEVFGPEGVVLKQTLNQLNQSGVTTKEITLSHVGQYSVSAFYKSSDGLRVGASKNSFKALNIFVTSDKYIVPLSAPVVKVELNSSDIFSISSAKFLLTSPNGSTKTYMLERVGGRFIKELSFSQTDPYAIGRWSIAPTVHLLGGIDRRLPSASFIISDDIPPTFANITQMPKVVTFMDEVNISCVVTDKGTGVRSVWVSYSSMGLIVNVTAKLVGPNVYSAVIPEQIPFTTVSYKIFATDNSGNTSTSETISYNVGVPIWLPIIVVLAIVSIALIAWLHLRRHKLALPPPPPS